MIDHQATKIITWFVEQVTEAWSTGDVDKSKALSGWGVQTAGKQRLYEVTEVQMCVIYTKDEKMVRVLQRSGRARASV